MNLQTLKNESPKLKGVTFALEKINDTLASVRITDADGNFCIITKDGTYTDTVRILVKAPPKKKTIYIVRHSIADSEYSKKFYIESDARHFEYKLSRISGVDAVVVEPIEIEVADDTTEE